jgi:3-oxoacyl-[acyl-carrier protein] reductase|tara:strand:+ start:3303 stop:4049 length:747 start_codon:yes stop_codon:yes gene_type:complete
MPLEMLKGKTALITGASRGIGKGIALELARNNANVIINYNKNKQEADKVVEEVKKLGVKGIALKADVSNFDEVKSMVNKIEAEFKRVDILVNNAGIVRDKTLKNMAIDDWHAVINTNLNGVFYVTKLVLPLMKEGSRIINISSIIGQYGNFGQSNYAAAKAGIIGLSKTLAKELGKKKITVNVIAPGFVKTDITKNIPLFKKKIIKYMTPLNEEGNPEDIANVVVFLASEKSRYMTGSVINIDGGLAF